MISEKDKLLKEPAHFGQASVYTLHEIFITFAASLMVIAVSERSKQRLLDRHINHHALTNRYDINRLL